MTTIEFTIEDQMDVLESKFYPLAARFATQHGLHEYKINSADINYLLDSWLMLRNQLGKTAIEAGYGN